MVRAERLLPHQHRPDGRVVVAARARWAGEPAGNAEHELDPGVGERGDDRLGGPGRLVERGDDHGRRAPMRVVKLADLGAGVPAIRGRDVPIKRMLG